MRWLDELLYPALKCARVGHTRRVREYRVYLYPPIASWAVAERAWMKRPVCKQCGHEEPEEEISRTALTGAERWRKAVSRRNRSIAAVAAAKRKAKASA
jgi:hypothetical protein